MDLASIDSKLARGLAAADALRPVAKSHRGTRATSATTSGSCSTRAHRGIGRQARHAFHRARPPRCNTPQDYLKQQEGELTDQNFASSLRSLSALVGGFTLPERISSGVTFRP
jgi:hypothetical protein